MVEAVLAIGTEVEVGFVQIKPIVTVPTVKGLVLKTVKVELKFKGAPTHKDALLGVAAIEAFVRLCLFEYNRQR